MDKPTRPTYTLRFFYEWGDGGECLWPTNKAALERFGYGSPIEEFPLSPETHKRVREIGEWYQTSLNWEYPPDPGPWRQAECDRFNAAVRILFDDLVKELGPDFEIACDQPDTAEDFDLDEYLKDPQKFRRKA